MRSHTDINNITLYFY